MTDGSAQAPGGCCAGSTVRLSGPRGLQSTSEHIGCNQGPTGLGSVFPRGSLPPKAVSSGSGASLSWAQLSILMASLACQLPSLWHGIHGWYGVWPWRQGIPCHADGDKATTTISRVLTMCQARCQVLWGVVFSPTVGHEINLLDLDCYLG